MERNHTIKLANGTVLDNLGLNGNNYISTKEVISTIFTTRNCSPVIFSDGETEELHEHMALIHVLKQGSEWWIALRDITEPELETRKVRADIDYIAMMTDIDL
jgi:hypothetical protein